MKNSHLDRRTKYSQQMMKTALVELLDEKELDQITVTDICTRADVNRGTFYRYYQDVMDLFEHMENDYLDQIKQIFEDDGESPRGEFTPQELELNLKKGLDMISENSELVWLSRKGGRISKVVEQIITYIKPYMMHVLENTCTGRSEEEREYLFEYFFGGVVSMIAKWVEDGMVIPIEAMAEMLTKEMEKTICEC